MAAGQTFRLKRHQWVQYQPVDLNGLGLLSTDQDVTLKPWVQTPASFLRYRGRPPQAQWPVLSRDVTGLQSTDQDVTLAPDNPGNGYLWRYRGRPQQSQWPTLARNDATGLNLADQDITLVPVPVTTPYGIRKGRPQWAQYTPTDPSSLESADQDVNLIPWVPDPPDYLRYRGRPQWAQYTPVDISNYPSGLPDQDVNLVPVSARMWRPPSRATFQQWPTYSRYDATGLELPDQDVNLIPWTQDPTDYLRWQGRGQWKQYTPTDLTPFTPALPDQDVNLIPWEQTTAAFLRYTGRQVWEQWPSQPRDVVPLLSTDQPLLDLVPWRQTTATYLRWRGNATNQWPVLGRDQTVFAVPDQDITLIPSWTALTGGILARRFGRAERLQPVYHDLGGLGLQLTDQDVRLVPVVAPRSTYLRYQGQQRWLVRVVYPGEIPAVLLDANPVRIHFREHRLTYIEPERLRGRDLWVRTFSEEP